MGTTPIGLFAPNGFGLYDMSGNVAEMVSDYYDERYYRVAPSADPKGPETGEVHVVRGGSWLSGPQGVGPTVGPRSTPSFPTAASPVNRDNCRK